MTGLEPWTSDIESDSSTSWTTTAAQLKELLIAKNLFGFKKLILNICSSLQNLE